MAMKHARQKVVTIGAILFVLILQDAALSAEQSSNRGDASGTKDSSKSFAKSIEEIRNSINEAWQKLTSPKTFEPARDKVNEAWKDLSDAASAAAGSGNKSQKDAGDKKDK